MVVAEADRAAGGRQGQQGNQEQRTGTAEYGVMRDKIFHLINSY
jgi:hypothetical protein